MVVALFVTAIFFCTNVGLTGPTCGVAFMPKVTNLSIQRRNKERVNVFLDGEFAFGLALIHAVGLRRGQELSTADIDRLKAEDAYERGKDAAIRLLSNRPRSRKEIRDKLREKEFAPETIERVDQRLVELNLLDDSAFARYWIDQRERFKPRSRFALQQELAQKGVPREIASALLDELDDSDAARRAAEKRMTRFAHLPKEAFEKKLGGFLQRRGFGYGEVREVVSDCWQQVQEARDAEEKK